MNFKIISLLILCLNVVCTFCEIKLVNVLFRHGDRAPGNFIKTFPNDPNVNNTFFPMGIGGLTNAGKLRCYNFGKLLRSTYNEFLGEVYHSREVEGISSNSERARMSLIMLLSGLYPPPPIQQWNDNSDWQPVLTSFSPTAVDSIFVPQLCEEYQKEYYNVKYSNIFQDQVKSIEPFMKTLTKDMGREAIVNPLDMNNLYHMFVAETWMNLTLPKWANKMFPDGDLRRGALLQYSLYGYNKKLRKLAGGILLRKMIKDMEKVQNKSAKSNYKIHLYSGHELNVVMFLQTLGLYNDHMPEYTSGVIVELHKLQDQYYVKVLYYEGIPAKASILKIPGCDELCPFNTFVKLLAEVTPTEKDLNCKRLKEFPK